MRGLDHDPDLTPPRYVFRKDILLVEFGFASFNTSISVHIGQTLVLQAGFHFPSCHVAAPNHHVKESVQEQNHIGPQCPRSRLDFEKNLPNTINHKIIKHQNWCGEKQPQFPLSSNDICRAASSRTFSPALLPLSAPRSSGGPRANLTGTSGVAFLLTR